MAGSIVVFKQMKFRLLTSILKNPTKKYVQKFSNKTLENLNLEKLFFKMMARLRTDYVMKLISCGTDFMMPFYANKIKTWMLSQNSFLLHWKGMYGHVSPVKFISIVGNRAEPNSVFAASALSISGKTIFKKIDK